MKEKHRRGIFLAGLILISFIFAACSKGTNGSGATGNSEEKQSIGLSEDMQKLLQETDWTALDNREWKDNTLDVWEASTSQLIKFKGEEGLESYGKAADDFCLTPSGASIYLSRLSRNSNGNIILLMERVRCTRDGRAEDKILARGQNLAKPEIMAYGIVSGTEELWGLLQATEEMPQQIFWQLNDDSTIQTDGKRMAVSFLGQDCDSEDIDQFMLDRDGHLFLLTTKMKYHEENGSLYLDASEKCFYVVSSQGGCLLAKVLERETKDTAEPAFIPLPEGKVGISTYDGEGSERKLTLFGFDASLGDLTPLAALAHTYLTNYAIALSNRGTVISADSGGIWERDLKGGEARQLYTWKNHGMRPQAVYAINASEENMIDLVFLDGEGLHYVSLRPVNQNRQITELVMAVSSSVEKFEEAVMRFNQKYPSYHLTLKSGYDGTRLSSELISGNGPVLIDTNLTGFETQKKYWEPLDGVLEAMGLLDELEPKALEAGKIDGTTYGIITDFYLETLITTDPATKNWNYDTFLEYLQNHSERPYLYMDYDANCGSLFVCRFWQHGLEDGVLLSGSKKESYFDTDRFRAILKLAQEKCQNNGKLDDKDARSRLYDGETSFLLTWFFKPSDVALFRLTYGDEAYIVGEPMQNGAAHVLRSADPITIRSTATLEEKKGALLFIRELLSYESQMEASKEVNFNFSVRKDVLKELIMNLDSDTYLDSNAYLGVSSVTKLGSKANPQKDYQQLQELLENSVPLTNLPKEISGILWEELDPYFEGAASQDDVIGKLKNRINLYLQEQ